MTSLRGELLRLFALALLRLGASWLIARAGIVALSDDDYARIVIAQGFADAPKLDPSGTSWLPFPFWLMGSAMLVFGKGLEVARIAQACFAVLSVWLLYAGARLFGMPTRTAFASAAFAAMLPLSLLLGVATVPELPTAALSAFALLAVTRPSSRTACLAGLAMLAATLSRYEAWPVAAVVALFLLKDAGQALLPRPGAPAEGKGRANAVAALAGATLALAGPVLWIAWNHHAHGHALHFLHRVSAYRQALGVEAGAVGAYILEVAQGSLTALLPLLVVVPLASLTKPQVLAPWKRPALAALAVLAFLLVGDLVDGAPTHHPERTLLVAWLLAAMALPHLLQELRWPPLHVRGPAANAMVMGFAGLLAVGVLRDTHLAIEKPAQRHDEEAVGKLLQTLVPRGERVLIATDDYGYFAVMAAFGRPGDVIVDETHDPRLHRERSLLRDAESVAEKGVRFVVATDLPASMKPMVKVGSFVLGAR